MPSLNFENLNAVGEEITMKKEDLENLPKRKFTTEDSDMSLSVLVTERSAEEINSNRNIYLKTNESMESAEHKFFDNFFRGYNEWTICDEPVFYLFTI